MSDYLELAIEQAEKSLREGGIPIGSVLVCNGKMLGKGHNQRIQKGNPILHGEMDALQNAGRLSADIYKKSTLYTTLSPCDMCSGAILLLGIPHVVIGENQTFTGAEELLKSRGVNVEVRQNNRCIEVMQLFIRKHPEIWHEDIALVV
ncbi:nucleoside deaminase [Parendozoicomonas sp. Alg238-R29]|uniref:nucleoside deaminase n=1 Tax=Parendozoicomonas sp. Alg238-R29 TaxID=2993446 RepID=UPI00248E7357|nr:nucleoside deaminase [Parendozoicomonas sp. Alg238-R29]